MFANNETGVIQPVAEAAALAHAAGALLHCDAVQGLGKAALDMAALGADLLSVNKFDHTKTKKVEGNASPLSTGEIYQVGRFFVRVR